MNLEPLWLSLQVALVATLAAGTFGLLIALLLSSTRFPGRDLLDVLITAPMVLPPTVLGYYLLVVLGRSSALGRVYEELTGSSIVFTRTGAVLAASVGALPFVVNAARAALESVDPRLIAAARTLGASRVRALFTVAVPLARLGIVAGLMLGFARALGDFGATLMVAGNIPGETQTAALAIYDAMQGSRDKEALGLVLVLTSLATILLYGVGKLARGSRRGI
jgi:molybdate transport system permease protein